MNGNSGEPVLLGVVIGTHGLRGDVKIRALSPDFSLLLDVKRVLVCREGRIESASVVRRPVPQKGNILLRLAGFEAVEDAEKLIGAEILVSREDLPAPRTGEWHWFQLQGMTAADRRMGEFGTLDDLFTTAAHDIYVVNGPYGEVMVPAVPQFIVEVDMARRRVLFDLPEGLISKTDDL